MDKQHTQMPFCGSRRLTVFLNSSGHLVNRKRVQRLMRLMRIEALYPKPKITRRNENHKIYPYLLKGVAIMKPDQVWSTDITYIRIGNGFMYLSAVIDWFSRYVLSWWLSNTLENTFCIEALEGDAYCMDKISMISITRLNFLHSTDYLSLSDLPSSAYIFTVETLPFVIPRLEP